MLVKLQPNAVYHMHYTYLHRRASDGTPFYIGKGSGRRAFVSASRSEYWRNVVKKHGLKVEICAQWPTEEEAYQHERVLIDCFQSMGFRLCNMTSGGDGLRQPTQDVRARMSASQAKRMANPEARAALSASHKGVAKTPEHVRKIAQSNTGKKRSQQFRDRTSQYRKSTPFSAEALQKIREANAKPVVCVERGLTFSSSNEAAKWMRSAGHDKADRRAISRIASGKGKSAYGYSWKYAKDISWQT